MQLLIHKFVSKCAAHWYHNDAYKIHTQAILLSYVTYKLYE